MAELICELVGVRGRTLKLYDTKCVIATEKSIGSFITGNITDGEKTIFLSDVVGVQFKKSGFLIGYLQFETSSIQMNNKNSNFFSENTFTYENGKFGITNEIAELVYRYVTDRIEEIKYGVSILEGTDVVERLREMTKPEEDETTEEEDPITKAGVAWDRWDENATSFGKCQVCGKKMRTLVYAEFDEGSETLRKNLCFECFSHRECRPVGRESLF